MMLTIRRALSALLVGVGLLTLGWAHWPSIAIATMALIGGWAIGGAGLWLAESDLSYPDPGARRRLVQPWRYGPLAWLWLLLVAPWLTKADDGPEGF